jgi:hypothetical protein
MSPKEMVAARGRYSNYVVAAAKAIEWQGAAARWHQIATETGAARVQGYAAYWYEASRLMRDRADSLMAESRADILEDLRAEWRADDREAAAMERDE